MAIIAVNTVLDEGTAITAGETWTRNSGAVLTIKTDTRVHAKAPTTTGTGSIGSITINEGEVLIDARDVRWLAYTGGSGNCPASSRAALAQLVTKLSQVKGVVVLDVV